MHDSEADGRTATGTPLLTAELRADEDPPPGTIVVQPTLIRRFGFVGAAILQRLHELTPEQDAPVFRTYDEWAEAICVPAKTARIALQRLRDAGAVTGGRSWWHINYAIVTGGPGPVRRETPRSSDNPRARIGFVYVFADTIGRVKIGWTSTDIPGRMKSVESACGLTLTYVTSFPGTMGDEGAVLRRLARSRTKGEWFIRTPEVDAWIATRMESAT